VGTRRVPVGATKSLPPWTSSYAWKCKQPRERGWEPLKRIKAHPILTPLVLVLTVLFPIIAGIVATYCTQNKWLVTVTALAGAWPDLNPETWAANNTNIRPWIGLGVGVSAFAVFGIPTLLGAAVTLMLENVERRIRMSLFPYLEARDYITESEVVAEFEETLKRAGIEERQCEAMARAAVKRAADVWYNATDEKIRRILENINIPNP
jgi:hypothetical protein